MHALHAHAAAGDLRSLDSVACRMQALSIGVGASWLARLCREIPRVSEHEGPEAASVLVEEADREHDRVRRVLRRLLQASAAAAIA